MSARHFDKGQEQLRAELVFIHGQKPSHSKARRVRVARALTET